MDKSTALELIGIILDSMDDLVVVFEEERVLLINKAFKRFFGVSSASRYNEEFGDFVNNFVPHPSYFHAQKTGDGKSWIDSILELEEADRVVSMMTPAYEPHAFIVKIEKVHGYSVSVFKDITTTLIKRIMIRNNTSIDVQSGAYAKNYFMHIAQSFQDAAEFNEKKVCAIRIEILKYDGLSISEDEVLLKAMSEYIKSLTRQDDMLVRWDDDRFVLVFLVDTEENAESMLSKLSRFLHEEYIKEAELKFKLFIQKEPQDIKSFIGCVSLP